MLIFGTGIQSYGLIKPSGVQLQTKPFGFQKDFRKVDTVVVSYTKDCIGTRTQRPTAIAILPQRMRKGDLVKEVGR